MRPSGPAIKSGGDAAFRLRRLSGYGIRLCGTVTSFGARGRGFKCDRIFSASGFLHPPRGMSVGSKGVKLIVVAGSTATAGVTGAVGAEGDRIFRNVPPDAIPAKRTTNPYRSQIFQWPEFWLLAKPRRICAATRSSVIQLIRRPRAG